MLVAAYSILALGTADYTVQPGDTLSEIARDLDVEAASLAAVNKLVDPHLLVVGRTLVVPPPPRGETTDASSVAVNPADAPARLHRVAAGEYLSTIARAYGLPTSALAAANQIDEPDLLAVGQLLVIPDGALTTATTVHVVRQGEYLGAIARTYNSTVAALRSLNAIADPHHIRPGQRLRVGGGGGRRIVVDRGETVSGIAAEAGTTVAAIVAANELGDPGRIDAGDVLVVPVPAEGATVACEASWYGDYFAGRPTASGEIFDTSLMTAASHFVPLPTWVTVTRPDTGQTVHVKINDRGPFHMVDGEWEPHPQRCIDLSEAAAAALGARELGHVPVQVAFPPLTPEVDRLLGLYSNPSS